MIIQPEDILKLLVAMALGGVIGMEREMRDKSAGFRTLMFISAGSALFTIFSHRVASLPGFPNITDPGRIAAQIVTGIGFLGGGVILREHGEVRGLTTASTIWLVAALGIGAGAGEYLFAVLATFIILLALLVFPSVEGLVGTLTRTANYTVVTGGGHEKYEALRSNILSRKLRIVSTRRSRKDQMYAYIFTVIGRPAAHADLVQELLSDHEVVEFSE